MIVLSVALLAAGCSAPESARTAGDTSAAPARRPSTPPNYAPAGDEGLGASVAIMVDNSGSMKDVARGDSKSKYLVAREALESMLASTDSFVASHPGFPVNVGLYEFSGNVSRLVPIGAYNREPLQRALEAMRLPNGGTAIGSALARAAGDLYRAGTIRKYILVVTDGANTAGRRPDSVAQEITRRSEGAVRMYFVAFDVDAGNFAFVHDVRGEVLGARNGAALRASLDSIYRGTILAEAVDAGESLPPTKKKP